MSRLILVTGATGNVGRHVVSGLLDRDIRVRAVTRSPESAGLPRSVELVRGDLTAPSSLDGCFDGVEAVFLLWRSPTTEAAAEFVYAAARHARRLVFLSTSAVRDDVEEQDNPIGKRHADIERAIGRSGLEWTFLRPGAFATNATWWWAPQVRAGDVVRWPHGAAAFPPIHERDIADVAVKALTEGGHGGAKYVLTGPETLTQAQQVRAIGEAIGRPLRFEEISPDVARRELAAVLPPPIVEMLLGVWSRLVDEPAPVATTAAEVTGTPARTFREWAIDHANDFRSATFRNGG